MGVQGCRVGTGEASALGVLTASAEKSRQEGAGGPGRKAFRRQWGEGETTTDSGRGCVHVPPLPCE